MRDSRTSSFCQSGRMRWSYESYSSKNNVYNQDTKMHHPSVTMQVAQEIPSQCVNLQQRSCYRQQRSSWQDSRSWYNANRFRLRLFRTFSFDRDIGMLFLIFSSNDIKIQGIPKSTVRRFVIRIATYSLRDFLKRAEEKNDIACTAHDLC